MTLPAGSLLQATMVMQHGSEKTANVLHFTNSDEITETIMLSDMGDVTFEWYEAYAELVQADVDFLGAVWSAPLISYFGSRTLLLTGATGTASGDQGQSTQYCIIRKYALDDSPSTRGRYLACGFPEQYTYLNQMTSTAVVKATVLADWIRNPVAATTTWQPVIYSRKNETWANVFKTTVDPVCRSYHGRQARGAL